MKKILLLTSAALALASCDMDINDNPNYPANDAMTSELQFPAAINAVATACGDALFNDAGFFVQYFDQRPEANQYNDLAELNIDETSDLFMRPYRVLYAGALQDLKEIADRSTNTRDLFITQVMRTQTFQILVDCTDKTPYTEILQGNSNSTPKYDDGQFVYESVLKELDDAEAAISEFDTKITLNDPVFNGSLAQWKGYANALRLRMYLRFIDANIDVAGYTAKAKALVDAGEFFTGDVAWDVYTNQQGQWNPWYATYNALSAQNHAAAYPIVEYYKAMNDPRISYAIAKRSSDGTYVGLYPGSKQDNVFWSGSTPKNADVSAISYSPMAAAPICLFTQSELQFLIAEVQLRFNNDAAAAQQAYEAAVKSDFAARGIDGADDFLAASGAWTPVSSDNLKLIYMQKWVALFMRDHLEAWSEQRRTDVPKVSAVTAAQVKANPTLYTPGELLIPVRNMNGNGGLCLSIPYSSDSRKYNVNTPAVRTITDRVFWDVK